MKNIITLPGLFLCVLFIRTLSAQGVELVKDIRPGQSGSIPTTDVVFSKLSEGAVKGDTFFFTADDGVHGVELWRSDGTEAGTWMVKDINPDTASSRPVWLTLFNDHILFFARHETLGLELWTSDGTSDGTYLLKDINTGAGDALRPDKSPEIRDMVVRNGVLYFAADGADSYGQLWRTDGTSDGTYALKSVCPTCTATSSAPGWFSVLGDNVYFIAAKSIWKSDGTTAGTSILVNGDGAPGSFSHMKAAGNRLYFGGKVTGTSNTEPYFNDGISSTATLLKDINTGAASSFPRGFTEFDGKVYFIANQFLWVTAGTSVTTQQFSTVEVGNPGYLSQETANLLATDDKLYFNGRGPQPFQEYLYATDGTTANTTLISLTNDFGFPDIALVKADNKVCYWGLHQNGGRAIKATDGVNILSFHVTNLLYVHNLWVAGSQLFFFAEVSTDVGRELYHLQLAPLVPLSVNISQVDSIYCFGAKTASLHVEVTGGISPYTYDWSVAGVSGNNPSNLGAGQYNLWVTDAGLNYLNKSFSISQPASMSVMPTITPASFGQSDGSITLTTSGTVPPYTYLWENGDTTHSLNNVAWGWHLVTVTDAEGCTLEQSFFVSQLTDIAEIENTKRWSVFPVPGHDWLKIDWQSPPAADAQLQLLDQRGTVIRSWDNIPQDVLDVSEIPAGVYILRLQSEYCTGSRKVILMD